MQKKTFSQIKREFLGLMEETDAHPAAILSVKMGVNTPIQLERYIHRTREYNKDNKEFLAELYKLLQDARDIGIEK